MRRTFLLQSPAAAVALVAVSAWMGLAPAEARGGPPKTAGRGKDTTPPTITVPSDITVGAYVSGGARVTFSVYATDNMDTSPTVTVSHASGSLFPVGTTTVTVTATDWRNNTSTKTFDVTVQAQVGDVAYKVFWTDSYGYPYFEWDITIAVDGTVSGTGHQTYLLIDFGDSQGYYQVDTLPPGLSGEGVVSGTVAADGTFQLESSSTYWYWNLEYDAVGNPVYTEGTAGFSYAATAYWDASAHLWFSPDPLASPSYAAPWDVQ